MEFTYKFVFFLKIDKRFFGDEFWNEKKIMRNVTQKLVYNSEL